MALAVSQDISAQASSFFVSHGNNISEINCGGILYAPLVNKYHQAFGAGAAWVRKQTDLRQPFKVSFVLDFTDTTAVDGGAFVFQTDSNAVGEAFNGFGYRKIDHSVAITFDPVQNNYDNDPDFDHISIQANGDLDHHSANNLAGPLSIAPFYTVTPFPRYPPVIQFHHLITVTWDPATITLAAAIDNNTYISVQSDIVQKIFNGNPMVYWGFTASNTQSIVYPPTMELTFGHMYFYFGDVFPRYYTKPILDTCFIQPINFFDSSVYASDYSLQDLSLFKWYWSFGDGSFSDNRNPPPHNYPQAGEYKLKFTATNQLGCTTDTLTRIIKLGSIPKPDFIADALCTNSSTSFKDATKVDEGTPVAWQWVFDNGTTSSIENPVTEFTTPGIKTVSLTVSTEFGCRADTTKTITVTDKPAADYNYVKDCNGVVSYTPVILNNTPVNEWQWNFGDGVTSNESNPSHHFLKNDVYINSMVVVSESGCVSDTIKKSIYVNKVYPYAGRDTILAIGQPLQLQASGGSSYYWTPSDGLSNAFIENPVANPVHDETYVLLVKNDDGCEGRDTISIKVYKGPELYIPSAFTPNNDGLNDVFRITGPGIKQLVYFRVFDRWGKLVFETKNITAAWDGTVHDMKQPSGTYVWIVKAIDYKDSILVKKGTVTLIR
ncbi:MAG: PKD domain-containing protein [Bacteroidota bacterium]